MEPPVEQERPERPPCHRSSRGSSRQPRCSKLGRSKWLGRSKDRSRNERRHHGSHPDDRTVCREDPRSRHRCNPRRHHSLSHHGKRSRHRSRAVGHEAPRTRRHCTRTRRERRCRNTPRHRHSHPDDRTPSHQPDSSSPSSTRHCTFNQPPASEKFENNIHTTRPLEGCTTAARGSRARLFPVDRRLMELETTVMQSVC